MKAKIFILISCAGFLFSCGVFFEKDISDQAVTLVGPADNALIDFTSVTFWWENLEDADFYRFQLVSPNFNAPIRLEIDTLVSSTQFTFQITPDEYQWRVRGENSGSETDYVTRSITVDSSGDLSLETVIILSPDNGLITNESNINFSWSPVPGAVEYRIQIAEPSFSGNIIKDTVLTGSSVSLVLAEGNYEWRVRGQAAFSNTSYSSQSIQIDLTPPQTPILIMPANGAFVSDTAFLSWQADVNSFADSLFVYTDSLLSPPILILETQAQSYSFFGSVGEFFWRVKTIDEAGNNSAFSSLQKFTLQ